MMDGLVAQPVHRVPPHLVDVLPAADRVLHLQNADGAILWFENGPWDPWNHTECVMALNAVGYHDAARAGMDYLHRTQMADGAWFGEYGNALPMADRDHIARGQAPAVRDSNFIAYPAVGAWHHYLITGDVAVARRDWRMVSRAMECVLRLQSADGTISWSVEAVGTSEDDALLAGNASIAKSLSCAILLGNMLGEDVGTLRTAHERLLTALKERPDVFDRRGQGGRFAMDWYYPILSHALNSGEAKARLAAQWEAFIVDGLGCRCVRDEPWVTVAESCELVMALLSIGEADKAQEIFSAQATLTDPSGVYWMGRQYEEEIFWPREQPSWTQAAVILAADALSGHSAASRVLIEDARQPAVI